MAGLARYFVFHCDGNWIVTLDGAPIARHPSQQCALNSAIVMADLMGSMKHDADVMVETQGELAVVWTYGVDTMPAQPGEAA
jgi:hypothetical protein